MDNGGSHLVKKPVWAQDAKTSKTYLTTRWVNADALKAAHTHTWEGAAGGLLPLADNIDKILGGTKKEARDEANKKIDEVRSAGGTVRFNSIMDELFHIESSGGD